MAEKRIIAATVPLSSGFTHILFNLAAQGFEWVLVRYSGGGDSGSVEEVLLIPNGVMTIEELFGVRCAAACAPHLIQDIAAVVAGPAPAPAPVAGPRERERAVAVPA